jgi:DNA primase
VEAVSRGGLWQLHLRCDCFASETRILTWSGIHEIGKLAGTTQRLMTSGGKWIDAEIQAFGPQSLMRITLVRNSVRKVIYATPGHRWFIKGQSRAPLTRRTDGLQPGDTLATTWRRPASARRVRPSALGIAHGVTFGDGSTHRAQAYVTLSGAKAELLPYFGRSHVLTDHRGDPRVCDLPFLFREKPSLNEAPSYLFGWLAGYFAADGTVDKRGSTASLSSAARENLEFVRVLAEHLGIGTYGIRQRMRLGTGTVPTALYTMSFCMATLTADFFVRSQHRERFEKGPRSGEDRRAWQVVSIESSDRIEEVFCAVVPGTQCFALEDNILTGNCPSGLARRDPIPCLHGAAVGRRLERDGWASWKQGSFWLTEKGISEAAAAGLPPKEGE